MHQAQGFGAHCRAMAENTPKLIVPPFIWRFQTDSTPIHLEIVPPGGWGGRHAFWGTLHAAPGVVGCSKQNVVMSINDSSKALPNCYLPIAIGSLMSPHIVYHKKCSQNNRRDAVLLCLDKAMLAQGGGH